MQMFIKFVNNQTMKVFHLSKIIDFVFGNLFVFLIAYVWTRFFWTDQRINISVSFFVTVLVCLMYNYFVEKKSQKKELSQKEIQNAENISTNFLFLTKTDIIKIFATNLSKKYQTKADRNFLLVNGNILYPMFESQQITDKDVLTAYQKTKTMSFKKLIITCNKISPSAFEIQNLITDKKIILLDSQSSYQNIYKPLEFPIPKIEHLHKKPTNIKNMFSTAFSKKQTKSYFFVSCFMLFGSFVLRYNIYYLIFASITTILALYSYFNKRFNQTPSPTEFIE